MVKFLVVAFAMAASLPLLHAQAAGSVPSQVYRPLTSQERWHRYWEQGFRSPGLYFASLGSALVSQLNHDPPEWHQGIAGYGRRTLSALGTFTIQTTVHEGGAALLGYEPRYLRCNCSGVARRTAHAVKWSLITKNREGNSRLDLPTLAAAYGSGMLSEYWNPHRYNPLTDGLRVGHQQVAFVVGIRVLQEFSPDIKRILHIRR